MATLIDSSLWIDLTRARSPRALKAYIALWARAAEWVRAHPDEWARFYYVGEQGLAPDDARYVVAAAGEPDIPADWSEAIGMEQVAADVAAQQGMGLLPKRWPRPHRRDPARADPVGPALAHEPYLRFH